MRRSILTLSTISALALGACSSGGDTASPSPSSSEPLQASPSDADEAKADAAKEAAANGDMKPMPTFESAYDAFNGPKFGGYWEDDLAENMAQAEEDGMPDTETEAREYSMTCDKQDQESVAGRDPMTGKVVNGTTLSCTLATTEEFVEVTVYDKAGPETEECWADGCFVGNGWVVSAESNGALKDTLKRMGLDKTLLDTIDATEYE